MAFAGKLSLILDTKVGGNLSEEGVDAHHVTIVFLEATEA